MKSARNHPAAAWRLPLAALAAACALAACDVTSADFSAYSGVNLIPDGGFEAWTPDQDIGAAPGTIYMDFRRLDTAAAASFATDTGFADSAALYAGLPDSANTAAGARPAVYRLEIKNLFKDGDFEASAVGTTSATGAIPGNPGRFSGFDFADSITPTWAIAAAGDTANNLGRGQALRISNSPNEYCWIDLYANTLDAAWTWSAAAGYNLSYRVKNLSSGDIILGFGDGTNPDVSFFRLASTAANTIYRFPQDATASSSSFNSSSTQKFLAVNMYVPGSFSRTNVNTVFDDFQLVNTDKTYAARFEVPLATAAAKADGSKLRLVQGGTYTFSVWVRRDPTAAWGDPARRLNAYPADKVSLALTDSPGSTANYWVDRTTVFDAPADAAWTKLSVNVTGLFSDSTAFAAAAETKKMLQLLVTPTDTRNNSTQFPGSILVAAPRLEFRATR